MQANIVLVHVSADTAQILVNFVANLLPKESNSSFSKDCEEMISSSMTLDLLKKILDNIDIVLSSENEKDIESFFQAFTTIMLTIESPEDIKLLVSSVVDSISSNTDSKQKLRLRVLALLFNLVSVVEIKFEVIKAFFSYAGKTNQSSSVAKFLPKIEYWAESWNLKVEQRRDLYNLVAEVLITYNKGTLPLSFLVTYLDSFVGSELPDDVTLIAISAVVAVVKAPLSSFSDRITLLESLSKHKLADKELVALTELLQVICSGSLASFTPYETESTKKELLVKYEIPLVELQRAMKLLTLCSLGATDATLPYAKIAKALSIPVDEVEMTVVEAISLGLLDATMDQFASTVSIR